MSGAPDPEYVLARRVLLDALQALGEQRSAVVLVGAQAIYLHTGDADLAVAPYTTDGDVAIDPSRLRDDPKLAEALGGAGFSADTRYVGTRIMSRPLEGRVVEVKIDLMVPEAVGGPGRRGARLGPPTATEPPEKREDSRQRSWISSRGPSKPWRTETNEPSRWPSRVPPPYSSRSYIVAGENQRGQRYECRVVPEAVDYLCDRTRGRNITSERAGGVIARVAERFKLPYTYGDRLRYSGQYVLLAAVALGRATVTKEGRSYVYSIKG